jgi:hypothetical protein
MTTPVDPISTAIAVARILESLGILHTIGGSIAASVAGEPRSTVDVDIVAAIGESQISALVKAFSPDFYIDEDSLRRAVRTHGTTNLIEQATQVKVDLFVAGGTALDEQQLNRRQTVHLSDGRTIRVHPPEDILLQKLRWYRDGGESSDRQWRDIVSIVRVQGPRLDREYLRLNAPTLHVTDLLNRAFEQEDAPA